MKTKDDSVSLQGMTAATLWALLVFETWHWEICGRECIVTRGTEEVPDQHPNSLHPRGGAFDGRRWYLDRALTEPELELAIDDLKHDLGPDYDVVPYRSHIHIEHDPKPKETQ